MAEFSLPSSIPVEALRILQIAIKVQLPNITSSCKSNCTIRRSTGGHSATIFELQIDIIWRNSKTLRDFCSSEHNTILLSLYPEYGHYKPEIWSPRDFYDNVFVPSKDSDTDLIRVGPLESDLFPFQKRAIQWLLQREGMKIEGRGMIVSPESRAAEDLPYGFFRTTDVNGRTCFVSHWLGIVTSDEHLLSGPGSSLHGGILAEEMGLGKTVEMVSLICLHKRTSSPIEQRAVGESLHQSSGTLIVTPPSILQQWKSEIQFHAPSLKVMIYEGIKSKTKERADEELITRLLSHDIVLTTYHVLATEIHYSGVTPDRNLRTERKYERKISPLVQIDWWRVALDECQMIDSGVSNAAKVAQVIPRQNAWAISGTPLKKEAKDLLGLLIFLRLEPYTLSPRLWAQLTTSYKPIFKELCQAIALRHTKEQVRGEIQLPTQKRVVLTIPFTQIEEQHYSTLYQQMCEDCGLSTEGKPLADEWDPQNKLVIEKMRTWLARLRQTCLHPEVGDRNRRALGQSEGPLRTVGEVLKVMIDQNETATRTEERVCHMSKLRRGQLLEHRERSQEALTLWSEVLKQTQNIVKNCREELRLAEEAALDKEAGDDSVHEQAATSRIGTLRLRLRSALEVEHIRYVVTA